METVNLSWAAQSLLSWASEKVVFAAAATTLHTEFSNHDQHRCVFQFELSIQKLGGLHARD
jgi:hypothetical protein